MRRIVGKWRPSLGFVVGGALAGTLGLSVLGLVTLRLAGSVLGYRVAVLGIAAGILVATMILGWLLVRLILRPVVALAGRAADLRADPMARPEPLAHYGTRELRDLGDSVLDMARRLQAREATIRSYTDHVTHEMKTPLSAVRAAVELLGEAELSTGDRRLVAAIAEAGAQMERQLAALREAAAAREPGHRGWSNLNGLKPGMQVAHPALRLMVAGGDVALPLDAEGLGIVLTQLLSNAASAGAREVRLIAKPGHLVEADDGPGVSAGNRARVFEPFFTTRRETGGTGMGLTIAANLLAAHGATIRLRERDHDSEFGAVFEIGF
jgi:two-component system, OmpR family, sensor kinase